MPRYLNSELADLLAEVDLGASVAEQDGMLEITRIETSAYTDLFQDRVDLVVGTKGSGKSAIYRLFVNTIADVLREERKVVIAHGTQTAGEPVFHAFKEYFARLTESDFVAFWCIYLLSLARDNFVRNPLYREELHSARPLAKEFEDACAAAGIPQSPKKAPLKEILRWSLAVLVSLRPKFQADSEGSVSLTVVTDAELLKRLTRRKGEGVDLPDYVSVIHEKLQALLESSDLQLWLMIDRLDEIFERRSGVETRALRGLLRACSLFHADNIRVKLFLRDDMLDDLSKGTHGFTALTHVTARMSNRLQWSEDQIQKLIVLRLFKSSEALCKRLHVLPRRFDVGTSYCDQAFYRVFPRTVNRGTNQSATLRWIYRHAMDGRGVVTPRDVIDLLTKAKQWQQDRYRQAPDGESEVLITAEAIKHGFEELSKRKRDTFLRAEFPHLWKEMEKLLDGKSDYSEEALRSLFKDRANDVADHFVAIGLFKESHRNGAKAYQIPFIYRPCLRVTQGKADDNHVSIGAD